MQHISIDDTKMSGTCVAFGCFDGLHIGHMAVIEKLLEVSGERGLAPVMVCFTGDDCDAVLTTEPEMRHLLSGFPHVKVFFMPVRDSSRNFVDDVLHTQLGAKAVIPVSGSAGLTLPGQPEGEYGIDIVECDAVTVDGCPVDVKRISSAIAQCRFDDVLCLLGRRHFVMGEVVSGKQLGRTIDQPTANIDFTQNKILPPHGVYVTMTTFDGESRIGLTNIGKRPSVDNYDYTTIENHILDYSGDLYGKTLKVEFCRYIRGVQKFDDLAAVKKQVQKDTMAVWEYMDSIK